MAAPLVDKTQEPTVKPTLLLWLLALELAVLLAGTELVRWAL